MFIRISRLAPAVALGGAAVVSLSACGHAEAWSQKTLHTFCSETHCADGAVPLGELTMDQAGSLYGTTGQGGSSATSRFPGYGVVFEYAPATGQYSVLYNFCSLKDCTDGKTPFYVKLVIDTNGNLDGTTEAGGTGGNGVVFELKHEQSGWVEKVLYAFCRQSKSCTGPGGPITGLTYEGAALGQPYDGTSPLYGTTPFGGTNGQGTVFSVTPQAGSKKWSETELYSLCSRKKCADGEQPQAPPFVDEAGNICGTTELGGRFDPQGGTVFELSPSGGGYAESTLYSFCALKNCSDGQAPYGSIIMDAAGNLLGTAGGGGSAGDGVVFELSPNGSQWQYKVLDNFTGANGKGPLGGLMLDASGNLFGATVGGGTPQKKGTLFQFNGAIQTVYDFCPAPGCRDGKHPRAGVIQDSAGNLYSTASQGTHHNNGTLYELSPAR